MPEADAPSWVDAAFVEEALQRQEEGVAVKSLQLRTLGAGGDHYASAMFRATAETSAGPRTVIVKVLPPGEALKELIRDIDVFRVEKLMLSDIVPEMHKLLEDAAPGRFPPFTAKCPHHGTEPEDFLFLEDLAPHGYQLADRHRGLGLRHALLALRTLARFHAASVAFLARNPSLPTRLGNPFQSSNDSFNTFVSSSFQLTAEASRKWPGFPQECTDILESLKNVAYDRYSSINEFRPGRFNVIVHGDFWVNNMMFRYEDGDVREIRFVDLQISHVTTPIVDILYFLNTSVSEDVSVHHADLLVREYHTELKETMDLLGLVAPTLKEILDEMDEFGFQSTFGCVGVLPIVKAEEVPDLDLQMSKEEKGQGNSFMYTSHTFERWMRRLIPEYHRKGWLSCKANE